MLELSPFCYTRVQEARGCIPVPSGNEGWFSGTRVRWLKVNSARGLEACTSEESACSSALSQIHEERYGVVVVLQAEEGISPKLREMRIHKKEENVYFFTKLCL